MLLCPAVVVSSSDCWFALVRNRIMLQCLVARQRHPGLRPGQFLFGLRVIQFKGRPLNSAAGLELGPHGIGFGCQRHGDDGQPSETGRPGQANEPRT